MSVSLGAAHSVPFFLHFSGCALYVLFPARRAEIAPRLPRHLWGEDAGAEPWGALPGPSPGGEQVRAGLRAVGSVTKTRCEVLVAADLATQSSKARKAAEWGKPVYSVAEFLRWAGE